MENVRCLDSTMDERGELTEPHGGTQRVEFDVLHGVLQRGTDTLIHPRPQCDCTWIQDFSGTFISKVRRNVEGLN